MVLLLILGNNLATHAENSLVDQEVLFLFEQAHYLAQQGIPRDRIIEIFKKSLMSDELCSEKPGSMRNTRMRTAIKRKILLMAIGGCVVSIGVIGYAAFYFMHKKSQPEQPGNQNGPERQQPDNQNGQQQQNAIDLINAPDTLDVIDVPDLPDFPAELVDLFNQQDFIDDQITYLERFSDLVELYSHEYEPRFIVVLRQSIQAFRNRDIAQVIACENQFGDMPQNLTELMPAQFNDWMEDNEDLRDLVQDPRRARMAELINDLL